MSDVTKTPFVRDLASSDKKIRDKATDSLTLFLRSKTDLSLIDLLKLWKGLFFCFYHSDRPLTQQALARTLSYSLVPTLPRSTLHRFLRAFWITIGRDFHSLDRLRLDKYLFLIRCYVGVAFEVLLKPQSTSSTTSTANGGKRKREEEPTSSKRNKKNNKNKKQQQQQQSEESTTSSEPQDWTALESYINIIEEGPLCPLNFDPDQPPMNEKEDYVPMPHGPDGLRYHVMDVWIDELEKVLEFEEIEGAEEGQQTKKVKGGVPMELLLRPIEKLKKESGYKPVRTRAAETLDDERLVEWGVKERKVVEESSDEEWDGFD
ncbi:ribosomal RNA processing 1 family protein [Aspergillus neoniger CBS 115656]|uniref:Ribosomal RNA processing protein n=1 Tax=Aspergillus neoniger (strain CBS 115656) TaxID=1448310 RepID=A0A318Z0R9_ASPNB|nr:ribosomal RNA processing protein [Aspergillus neoniger CBS 115656]PYH39887.1 ribosomal RNA processing protein [Aspergillus neoniger CBS 115656]